MAQKVQTLFIDDIDGSAAEGTVRFELDGTEYEIDLNAEHAQQLRDALAAYVRAGRRVSGGTRRPARGGRRGSPSALNTTEVRESAKAQWPCVKTLSGIVTVSWHMMVLRGSPRTAGCRTGSRSGC